MNCLHLSAVVALLLTAGCGVSHLQNAERLAQQRLANELQAAPAVELTMRFEGDVMEGRLSEASAKELSTLIEEAIPNHSSVKYSALGEIRYQRADGRQESLLLLLISDSEAGLCLADGTNLRQLSLNRLKGLIGASSEGN